MVFESKKVSVLVADPKHTKINVKAELSKSGNELGGCVSDCSTHPKPIDLPLGVSSSMINQLQVNFTSRFPPPTRFDPYHSCIHPFVKSISKPCVDSFDLFLLEVKAILVNRD